MALDSLATTSRDDLSRRPLETIGHYLERASVVTLERAIGHHLESELTTELSSKRSDVVSRAIGPKVTTKSAPKSDLVSSFFPAAAPRTDDSEIFGQANGTARNAARDQLRTLNAQKCFARHDVFEGGLRVRTPFIRVTTFMGTLCGVADGARAKYTAMTSCVSVCFSLISRVSRHNFREYQGEM